MNCSILFYFSSLKKVFILATHEERKLETQTKIIKSAKKLFNNTGYKNTSVEQIIKLANISKGTFYKYFETKVDILVLIAREDYSDKTKEALSLISNGVNALSILEQYLDALSSWFESKGKLSKDIVQVSMNFKENSNISKYSGYGFIYEVLKASLKQNIIKKSTNISELTELIGGAIIVSVLSWSADTKKGELQKSLNCKYKLILEGVQND